MLAAVAALLFVALPASLAAQPDAIHPPKEDPPAPVAGAVCAVIVAGFLWIFVSERKRHLANCQCAHSDYCAWRHSAYYGGF